MQADNITSSQQLIEFGLLNRHIIDPKHMTFETEHPAAKGVAQPGNLQPDGTASNNPQSLAAQFVANQLAVGGAAPDGRVPCNDPPQQCDHQANGQLAYRMDSVTGRVMKNNAVSLTRVLIHVVYTGKRHADQLELGTGFDYCP